MKFTGVLDRPADGPDLVLRYADHADGIIDVFLPPSLGRPVAPSQLLVALHGGFWRQEFDRRHLRPLANALARRGFVVALPEYRRVAGLGGWPSTGYDVTAALGDVPTLLTAAAPGRIDATAPCVLTGHSAGGHLAMWAGLRAGRNRISRIVALAPVTDLVDAARQGLGANAVQALLGGGPDDVPVDYADAGVLGLIDGDVPVTIIQGTADEQVPVEMNRRFAARHPSIDYIELDGVEHFALIDPLEDIFESVVFSALTN